MELLEDHQVVVVVDAIGLQEQIGLEVVGPPAR
jgi:hypothetical protein